MAARTDKITGSDRQAELFDLLGTTVGGKYRLERLLGTGGMGGVYAATPLAGGSQVAIKVLSVVDPDSRDRIAKRFAREARAVADHTSDHIVKVLDAGSDDARPFLVMELLEGEDLGQRLRRDGMIPLPDTLHIAAQVLVALGTVHDAGVVHRDLKPDNVFIVKKEGDASFCKLLDFGMSKMMPGEGQTLALALTKKGMAVGTPYYMAPEQARAAEDVDGRIDLWALGAIMFECLTGRPPFVGKSQEQILIAICTTEAPDVRALQPAVPSRVAKLIARALTADRKKRFATAWEMLATVVEIAPAERPLMPAGLTPTLPLPPTPTPTPTLTPTPTPTPTPTLTPTPPVAMKTVLAGHIADSTGPQAALFSQRAPPKRKPPSRVIPVVVVALCALVLGIGVAVYVLAMMSHPR